MHLDGMLELVLALNARPETEMRGTRDFVTKKLCHHTISTLATGTMFLQLKGQSAYFYISSFFPVNTHLCIEFRAHLFFFEIQSSIIIFFIISGLSKKKFIDFEGSIFSLL